MKADKNTNFDQGAGMKWGLHDKCWLCEKFRYTVIVFNRANASAYYTDENELIKD